jgi:Dolichyl-phosphate-mannose-protein mannosyltransferase
MSESLQNPPRRWLGPGDFSAANLLLLALLTVLAFLVMGYHPGLEDDAFYLAAIKRNLNPALFPHDAEFFRLQFQATIFDKLIAWSVRLSHVPLAWAVLLWQFVAIFFLLHGCWRISRRCFSQPQAQWAAVATVAVLLTLPVSGVGITLADQYLHPRTLATAAILAAIVAVLDRRLWLGGILLAVAFSIHAIMASFGISFCAFLLWNQRGAGPRRSCSVPLVAALIPLGWIFEPASDAWRQAASTRSFYFLSRWEWYEWLGIFGPLILLYILRRFLQRDEHDSSASSTVVNSLFYYGIFQTAVGLLIMLPPSLERLRPFEPMRYLHLLYLLFFLLAGGLLGRYILDHKIYRWLVLFISLSAGMFYAQRQMFSASAHLELPGAAPQNPWLRAFAWIRQNTPVDSLFALDPHYVTLPGEDYHGFRALAERSVLADYEKDGGMAARVPRLAPRWLKEVTAQADWKNFQPADFQRLKQEFGVTWVVLATAAPNDQDAPGMTCPYRNAQLQVCRLY